MNWGLGTRFGTGHGGSTSYTGGYGGFTSHTGGYGSSYGYGGSSGGGYGASSTGNGAGGNYVGGYSGSSPVRESYWRVCTQCSCHTCTPTIIVTDSLCDLPPLQSSMLQTVIRSLGDRWECKLI